MKLRFSIDRLYCDVLPGVTVEFNAEKSTEWETMKHYLALTENFEQELIKSSEH